MILPSGFSTALVPDFPQLQPSPGPTLALAAALTDLWVGTWAYASPLRPAWSTAWEAHSLSVLTERRFERASPSERLARVRETVTMMRELDRVTNKGVSRARTAR